jgi:formamidopyrimidine-DNA glycosylase
LPLGFNFDLNAEALLPELPEVEIVRRGLEPVLVGKRIVRVELRRRDLRTPFPDRFAERVGEQKVSSLTRRAKYLVGHLTSGEALVMHLGMSGRFTVKLPLGSRQGGAAFELGEFAYETGGDPAHDHVVFHIEAGTIVTYNDPRRFGLMTLIPEDRLEQHKLFAGLGVEPLGNELNTSYLASKARARTADLKAFLMDQRIVAGLGNIYVSEALYRAHLSPNRSAACLAKKNGQPTERAERLVPAIRSVLEDAITAGGSTLRDYRNANGDLGYFQHSFAVYGREGEPCLTPDCRGTIRRVVQGGRSTFYCGVCQR